MLVNGQPYRTVWLEGPRVKMIDQPRLPHEFRIAELPDHRATARAISEMTVRGAGAIGVSAGMAVAQACLEAPDDGFWPYVEQAEETIRATRPTAHNLFWAVKRVDRAARAAGDPANARRAAIREAEAIGDEDAAWCEAIGRHGEPLVQDGARVLTHCNAGWLAFADWGSALSPVYAACRAGKKVFVFASETRPRCQGARLTAWELAQEGVPCALIADNAAGPLFAGGEVDLVLVGADRIAANGDVANKVGTYTRALLAREHQVPFYVAAPLSTIDPDCPNGAAIPIEERGEEEVLTMFGQGDDGRPGRVRIAPIGTRARNPAFDITPAALIAGIITPVGIFAPDRITEALCAD